MQRFAGDDETRLAALHRVAAARPSVALATRGGYGLTRLLDRIDWKRIAKSVEAGTRWVGMSDMTSLQLGLLAHAGGITWAGPLACDDFGRSDGRRRRRRRHRGVLRRGDVGRARGGRLSHRGRLRRPRRSRHALGRQPGDRQLAAGDAALAARSRAASCSSRTSTSIRIGSSATCCSCSRPACSTRRRRSCSARSAAVASRRTTAATAIASMLARVRAATRTPILTGLALRPRADQGERCRSAPGCSWSSTVDRRSSAGPRAPKNHDARLRRRASMLQAANGLGHATTAAPTIPCKSATGACCAERHYEPAATGASGARRPVQRG